MASHNPLIRRFVPGAVAIALCAILVVTTPGCGDGDSPSTANADISELVEFLRDGRLNTQIAAARLLGECSDDRVIEALIAAADTQMGNLLDEIQNALVKTGEPAVEPLIQALAHKSFQVRDTAVEVLGRIGNRRAVEPLLALAKSEKDMRTDALVAVHRIGDPRGIDLLVEALDVDGEQAFTSISAVYGLGATHDVRAVDPLLRCLSQSGSFDRSAAVEALAGIPDARAVDGVLMMMRNEACSDRILSSIAEDGDDMLFERLLQVLEQESESLPLRICIARILERSRKTVASELLQGVLQKCVTTLRLVDDSNARKADVYTQTEELAASLAAALGMAREEQAIQPLLQLAQDQEISPFVRGGAIRGLGLWRDARALPVLKAVLDSTESCFDRASHREFEAWLETTPPKDHWGDHAALDLWGSTVFALAMLQDEGAAAILADAMCEQQSLTDRQSSNDRQNAILQYLEEALRRSGSSAVTPLMNLIDHRSPYIRETAVQLLGECMSCQHRARSGLRDGLDIHEIRDIENGRPPEGDILKRVRSTLEDPEDRVSIAGAIALLGMGDADGQSALMRALRADTRDKCRRTAEALKAIGWQPTDPRDKIALLWAGASAQFVDTEECLRVVEIIERNYADFVPPGEGRTPHPVRRSTSFDLATWATLLGDPSTDWVVRYIALCHFYPYRRDEVKKAAGPGIVTVLGNLHDDWKVHELAIEFASSCKCEEAVPALIRLMCEGDWRIRQNALKALWSFDWQPETDEQRVAGHIAMGEIDECLELGAPAIKYILTLLSSDQPDARVFALRALARAGDLSHVDQVLAMLDDPATAVRVSAVNALAKLQGPDAFAHLVNALQDSAPKVQIAAIKRLGDLADSRAAQPIIQLLGADPEVTEVVVSALGAFDDPGILDSLAEWLSSDPYPWEAVEPAIRHLATIGNDRALSILGDLLAGDRLPRQPVVVDAISTVGGPEAARLVVEALDHPRLDVARAAADALDRFSDTDINESLIEWLARAPAPSEAVACAVNRVGRTKDARLVPILRALRSSGHGSLRRSIAGILADIGGPDAAEMLVTMLQDSEDAGPVRTAISEALGRLDHADVITPCMEAIRKPELPRYAFGPIVRRLGETSDERALAALVELLSMPQVTTEESCSALRDLAGALDELGDGQGILVLIECYEARMNEDPTVVSNLLGIAGVRSVFHLADGYEILTVDGKRMTFAEWCDEQRRRVNGQQNGNGD